MTRVPGSFARVDCDRGGHPAFASTCRYGKTVSKALSISLYLAQRWSPARKTTAEELARELDLPRPWVARLLGYLSHAEVVKAFRGPGGGYLLARHPATIRLSEVVSVFQNQEVDSWLRDADPQSGIGLAIQATNGILNRYLERTTLGVFVDDSDSVSGSAF